MPFPDERLDDFGRRSFLLLFVNLLSESLGTIRQNVDFSLFCDGFLKEYKREQIPKPFSTYHSFGHSHSSTHDSSSLIQREHFWHLLDI